MQILSLGYKANSRLKASYSVWGGGRGRAETETTYTERPEGGQRGEKEREERRAERGG